MIINNNEIKSIGDFLLNLPLKGKQSRMRSRFINLLQGHLDQISSEQQLLLNEHLEYDESDNPVTQEVDGQVNYKIKNAKEYQREMALLMSEDFILEESPKVMDMLLTIQEVVFSLEDMEISGTEAMTYNYLYELFEDVGEEMVE